MSWIQELLLLLGRRFLWCFLGPYSPSEKEKEKKETLLKVEKTYDDHVQKLTTQLNDVTHKYNAKRDMLRKARAGRGVAPKAAKTGSR